MISLDTLRADRLGCYGHSRDTSPFIDSLAARGLLFENAYVQLPGTLPSHMSIFTGLYPAEHGVFPPEGVLSEQIKTLPEIFQSQGFRTAGHTEGGYVHGGYGFARGFDEFSHEAWKIETDIVRTFERGLEFLKTVGDDEQFFVFLHSYAIHDPYPDARLAEPLDDYRTLYWSGDPPSDAVMPTGPELVALNRKGEMPRQEVLDYFQAVYDSQIRHVDDVLRKFFAALEAEGLLEDLTVVLTSDHGEEFGEHGELLHNQIYRETLHVPLLLVHPSLETGKRIPDLVQSIDIAPTFYDIAGIEPPQAISGKSLVPLAEGAVEAPRQAFAETWDGQSRGLIRQTEGGLHQLVWSTPPSKGEWAWITQRGEMIFDTFGQEWVAEAASFHVPRQVEILVDGKPVDDPGFDPMVSPDGTTLRLQLPQDDRKKRVTVRATSCDIPAELGLSEDPRCLSIRLRVSDLWRIQLFDNASDPLQARDLSGEDSGLSRSMLRQLGAHRPEPLFTAGERELDPELEARLRALGYLND